MISFLSTGSIDLPKMFLTQFFQEVHGQYTLWALAKLKLYSRNFYVILKSLSGGWCNTQPKYQWFLPLLCWMQSENVNLFLREWRSFSSINIDCQNIQKRKEKSYMKLPFYVSMAFSNQMITFLIYYFSIAQNLDIQFRDFSLKPV